MFSVRSRKSIANENEDEPINVNPHTLSGEIERAPCHRVGVFIINLIVISIVVAFFRVLSMHREGTMQPGVLSSFPIIQYQYTDSIYVYLTFIFGFVNCGTVLLDCTISILTAVYVNVRSRYALYFIPLAFAVAVQVIGLFFACLALIFVEGDLHDSMMHQVKNVVTRPDYRELTLSWNVVQTEFTCCGVNSSLDYNNSYMTNHSSQNNAVPSACCLTMNRDHIIEHKHEPQPYDLTACQDQARNDSLANNHESADRMYHNKGCYTDVSEFAGRKLTEIIILYGLMLLLRGLCTTLIIVFVCSTDATVIRMDKKTNIIMPNRMV